LCYLRTIRANLTARRVKYKKAVVAGKQFNAAGLIVVAKEMYIFPGKVK